MRGFRFRSILYSKRCACILSSAFSKFKCLAAKHVMRVFKHTLTYFLLSSLLLDPKDDITARGFAWTSPEATADNFCWFFIATTTLRNFRRFLRHTPERKDHLLVGSYSGQIFPRRNLLTRPRK